jgi:phosphate transport system substrate-binding protein
VADYLSRVSPAWKERLGARTSLAWGEHVSGAKGSDGVRAVQETPGAIGYVDFNYVGANGLNPAQLRNAAGEFWPGVAGFLAALR